MTPLKELRKQSGKRCGEVAQELGVTYQALCNYEAGIRRIGLEQVLILAKLYDCTAEDVIEAQLNSCPCAR